MFEYSAVIDSSPVKIWDYLTKPDLMRLWMGDPEMNLVIETDWTVKGEIKVKGFHHVTFENKGLVEIFEKNRRLKYTSLSSISRLADQPENYTSTEFTLEPTDRQTRVIVKVEHFPTDSIYQHYNFYWRGTIVKIKELVEE
ncbi:MAG TPA: SRPBCC domain-containing protein [Chryseolinea sp.]|nr:SRPBCC domain-containing protein [Chryseolinea sp.]